MSGLYMCLNEKDTVSQHCIKLSLKPSENLKFLEQIQYCEKAKVKYCHYALKIKPTFSLFIELMEWVRVFGGLRVLSS